MLKNFVNKYSLNACQILFYKYPVCDRVLICIRCQHEQGRTRSQVMPTALHALPVKARIKFKIVFLGRPCWSDPHQCKWWSFMVQCQVTRVGNHCTLLLTKISRCNAVMHQLDPILPSLVLDFMLLLHIRVITFNSVQQRLANCLKTHLYVIVLLCYQDRPNYIFV